MSLTTLDVVVFFFILIITFTVVIIGQRFSDKDSNSLLDYLLMGRKLTLPFFVMSLVSTWYGGIFGVTQISYEFGLYNFLTQGLFWYLAYFLFAFFILPKARHFEAMTMADLVGKMFGPKARIVAALFNFISVLPIVYIISLGLLTQAFFGGSLIVNMSLGMLFVLAYSSFGGLRSVVLSDSVQFVVMCLSVFMVIVFSYAKFGGIDFLISNLPESHFKPFEVKPLATTLVWGFIALSTLVDPGFYQRCFAAKNETIAKNGILISISVWILFDLCTTFGGMYARAVLPQVDSAQAYLLYSLKLLPDGLRGFFVAGIVATILSTLDSYLFIASNSVSFDLLPVKFQSKKNQIIGLFFVGILTLILTQIFNGSIAAIWKMFGSFSAGSLLFPVMIGLFFPGKIIEKDFLIMVSVATFSMLTWNIWGNRDIEALYIGLFSTLSSFLLLRLAKFLRLSA